MDPEGKNLKLTPDSPNHSIEQEKTFEFDEASFQEGILDYGRFISVGAKNANEPRQPKDYIEESYVKESARSIEQRSKMLGFAFSAAKYRDPSIVFEILKKEGLLSDNPSEMNRFLRWISGKRNLAKSALAEINNPVESQLGINVDPEKEIRQFYLFEQLTRAMRAKNPSQAHAIAEQLCGQTVDITHGTWKSGLSSILRSGEIWSSEGGDHYYGNGVYVGVNGGFRHWGEQKLIYFRQVPAEKLLPVINAKEPMANIPAEKIKISDPKRFDGLKGLSPDDDFFSDPPIIEATPSFETNSYRFHGFSEPTDKKTLRQIDELLGLVKVKKAYDDFYEIYDRVYVKDKRPLVCMAVMNSLKQVGEIVWDEQVELPLAKQINFENPKEIEVVVEQILSCYETEGRDLDSPHGRRHIERVIENIKILSDEIKTDIKTRHMAMIAAAAHDIIRYARDISPNWASALWAKRLLKGLIDHKSLKEIRDAIVQHNGPREARVNDTVVTQLLYDADKMDTRADRFHMPIREDRYDDMADGLFEDYIKMVMESVSTKIARNYLDDLLKQQKQRKEMLSHERS